MFVLQRGWPFPGELSSKRSSPTVGLRLLSGGVSLNKASSTTLLPVRLQWAAGRHDGTALLDSGAEGNLLDISLAQLLHIPMVSLRHKISVTGLSIVHGDCPLRAPQWTIASRDQPLHDTHHPHHLRQSLRDYHFSHHQLTTGSGGVRSPLAHTTQSSGGLGSQHHL